MSQVFVKLPVEYVTKVRRLFGGTKQVTRHSLVGVREYFPDTFRTAYRQRARWILGIGLQGWQILGWKGSLKHKYLLFRDRKGVFTSLLNVLALVIFLLLGGLGLAKAAGWTNVLFPRALQGHGWIMAIMVINGIFMLNRCLQRFIFVGQLFGPFQGLLSLPRILVGNFVNFAATIRAWRLFILHLITGRRLAWDKTVHSFPTEKELLPFRKKLGEILLTWKEIDQAGLDEALQEQKEKGMPLGRILLKRAWVDEAVLADAIAQQAGLPRSTVHFDQLETLRTQIPLPLIIRFGLVPLGLGELEETLLGVITEPSAAARKALSAVLSKEPKFFVITESERSMALAYYTLGHKPSERSLEGHRLLGDLLVESAEVAAQDLAKALEAYDAGRDGHLGRFLVNRRLISEAALERALEGQTTRPGAPTFSSPLA
jgi:adsorption protein B